MENINLSSIIAGCVAIGFGLGWPVGLGVFLIIIALC